MARRNKTTVAEALVDLVALFPWWGGVALAIAGYLVLHQISLQPVAAIAPGQMGAAIAKNLVKSLATFAQYVVPLVCLAGAGLSAWRRRQRTQLASAVAGSDAADVLDGMTWQQFEMLVGEGFRRKGFQVVETGGGGSDGGVDLVLSKRGEKYLVQCKQWRAFKVGVEIVRELYGVMAARGATGGFVVTSGRFSAEASRFAEGRNVTLMDGDQLKALLRSTAGASPVPAQRTAAVSPDRGRIPVQEEPRCPLCARPMARRRASRGSSAGQEFWGCTGYPNCRGTRIAQ